MPLYPQFQQQYTEQLVTDAFGGYDHRLRIPEGAFYDTRNLTSDFSPMLASRAPRGLTGRSASALIEKDALAYVGSDRTLYYNWLPTALSGLAPGEKQLVSMGAYIVVFPDKVYLNTEDLTDCGSLEAVYSAAASYQMCRSDGTVFSAAVSASEPANPANGDYWIDSSGSVHVLKQWSGAQQDWISVETACIKISFSAPGVSALFAAKDGVEISGSSVEDVNGDKVIEAVGEDWIMVAGLADTIPAAPESITVSRSVPALDYVCECRNRLWGCRYGLGEDGRAVNEICCSALGDFKNWRRYQGLSTDSWTGSVGSDGPWTGAVNYLGYPTFFKENRIHRVTVSAEGAHRIDETVCRGVQKGSAKSLAVVNETLYYKSPTDVCAYRGGFPQSVSQALGGTQYRAAAAGAVKGKYYVSMADGTDGRRLFVYDIARELWLREDEARITDFARVDDELYAIEDGRIITMLGSLPDLEGAASETDMRWGAVSGVQYYEQPENKRLSRFNIRMRMAQGASVRVYLRYDGDLAGREEDPGGWVLSGQIDAAEAGIGHYVLPVRPRRCDHLQMAIEGTGSAQIYSIARILEVGSDYR